MANDTIRTPHNAGSGFFRWGASFCRFTPGSFHHPPVEEKAFIPETQIQGWIAARTCIRGSRSQFSHCRMQILHFVLVDVPLSRAGSAVSAFESQFSALDHRVLTRLGMPAMTEELALKMASSSLNAA